jgi:hypothetical protein
MSRPTVYVVLRVAYERTPWDDAGKLYEESFVEDQRAGRPERAFTARSAAEAYLRKQQQRVWCRNNPFDYEEEFAEVTSFDEPVFRDWLEDLTGLRGPEADETGRADWQSWFGEVQDRLTRDQRCRIWEQMDRVELYRIVELPIGG